MRRITVSLLILALILLGLTGLAAAQNVSILLTPQGLPIQIPGTGGSFNNLMTASAPALDGTRMPNGRPLFPQPVDSSQPDTIKYDIGGFYYCYGASNLWGIVRFTAPFLFELRCIYIQMLNNNQVTNGVEVYVYDDNGSGLPGTLISGPYGIPGPLFIGYTWLDVEVDQPYPSLAAGQNFFVVFGPAPTGPPTQGWFLYYDGNGNTENRSGYGTSQQGPWNWTFLVGDLIVRAGGILSGGPQNPTITLTPVNPPIQIPAAGGSFSYNIAACNPDTTAQRFDVWCMVTLPNGNPYGPVLGPVRLTLSPGQMIERRRTQNIPRNWAMGTYAFNACIGVYPDSIWDSDNFPFEKLGAGGADHWVALYNGPANDDDYGYDIAVDQMGNVYVTGQSVGVGTGISDYATVKYNAAGMQQWVARYAGPWEDSPIGGIALDIEGNVYVTGQSPPGPGQYDDYTTIKYNTQGLQLWVARYNGPTMGNDEAYDIVADRLGNAYVTGASVGGPASYDCVTIKYNTSGNQEWVARYNGPGNSSDAGDCIALDSAGNLYITGSSYGGPATCEDYITIKYDSAGNPIWEVRYNGPGNGQDYARSLAVDGDQNVYVAGTSDAQAGSQYNYDYATIKYNSEGEEWWVARYNGLANGWDEAYSVAVDGAGNVYVTGVSHESVNNTDYATVKYDIFGNQVWVAIYNGPGDTTDVASSIALDSIANVYVSGASIGGSSSGCDFATIKYSSNGNLIWVHRYNGSANGTDGPTAIALDNTGHVHVTGCSDTDPSYLTNFDYCTIKYSGGNLDNWMPVEATLLGQPLPQECRLEQNYPNPFNATTAISFELRAASFVNLAVYDVSGRLVETIVDGWRSAGEHQLTWEAGDLPSGMYVCRIQARPGASVPREWTESGKMILLK